MNRAHRHAAAFSLIEILISVLILALGLLGLGALFPVVLREQRIGTDNIQGVLVTNNVKSLLAQMDLNALMPTGGPPNRDVWSNWRWRAANGQAELDRNTFALGQWHVPVPDTNGEVRFGDPRSLPSTALVPLATRLYPSTGSDQGKPQYVWDIAVHRVPDFVDGNPSLTDPFEVVIFVRKVDPRIRVAVGSTLSQVLLGGVSGGDRRLPVGRQNGATYLPTLDGTDGSGGLRYSEPVTADRGADFDLVIGDGRYITNLNVTQADGKPALMAQPNQKLVDNLGNVYTVEAVEPDPTTASRKRLRINPPIAANLTVAPANDAPHVNQFIFTAQIPAGVSVMEVLP